MNSELDWILKDKSVSLIDNDQFVSLWFNVIASVGRLISIKYVSADPTVKQATNNASQIKAIGVSFTTNQHPAKLVSHIKRCTKIEEPEQGKRVVTVKAATKAIKKNTKKKGKSDARLQPQSAMKKKKDER